MFPHQFSEKSQKIIVAKVMDNDHHRSCNIFKGDEYASASNHLIFVLIGMWNDKTGYCIFYVTEDYAHQWYKMTHGVIPEYVATSIIINNYGVYSVKKIDYDFADHLDAYIDVPSRDVFTHTFRKYSTCKEL